MKTMNQTSFKLEYKARKKMVNVFVIIHHHYHIYHWTSAPPPFFLLWSNSQAMIISFVCTCVCVTATLKFFFFFLCIIINENIAWQRKRREEMIDVWSRCSSYVYRKKNERNDDFTFLHVNWKQSIYLLHIIQWWLLKLFMVVIIIFFLLNCHRYNIE